MLDIYSRSPEVFVHAALPGRAHTHTTPFSRRALDSCLSTEQCTAQAAALRIAASRGTPHDTQLRKPESSFVAGCSELGLSDSRQATPSPHVKYCKLQTCARSGHHQ